MAQLVKLIDKLPLPPVPSNLTIGREINRGAWGVVHEGRLGGQPVAVKKVHQLLMDAEGGENTLRSFFEECERLKAIEHPHVIEFRGAYKDKALEPILVMEKMSENLRQFLERRRGNLDNQEQIRISLEITQGVAFLHQLNPPMIHRDLNDKNVMFTFSGVAKIGDFGQSKLKQDLYLTTDLPGMVSFMPPEALGDGNSKYDESLDMFSLGVLMLEIGTQQPPISSIVGIGVTPEVERRGEDLGKMSDLHPLKHFILLCISDDAKQRPKASHLEIVLPTLGVNILQTMLDAEMRSRSREKEIEELQEKSVEMQLLLSTKVEKFNAKPVNLTEAQMATPVQDQQQDDSTMFNSKAKRKGSKRGSSIKQRRNYLKEEFGTIVANKDDDILTLIEENKSLKESMETMERTLLMKCSRVRDLEHDILQLTQGTHLLDVQASLSPDLEADEQPKLLEEVEEADVTDMEESQSTTVPSSENLVESGALAQEPSAAEGKVFQQEQSERSMQEGEFSIIGMQLCDSTTGKELVSVERPPNIANVGATLSPVGTSPTTPVEESVS